MSTDEVDAVSSSQPFRRGLLIESFNSNGYTYSTPVTSLLQFLTNEYSHMTSRKSVFQNQLMWGEDLESKPVRCSKYWYMKVYPVGSRRLVVSHMGFTAAYNKAGNQCINHSSNLPMGNITLQGYGACVLDCIYCPETETYFVLDMICWDGQPMYHCKSEDRFQELWTKLQLYGLTRTSVQNPYPFVPLKAFVPTNKTIPAVLRVTPFQIHKLIFYHKDSPYIPGDTPLVLLVQPEHLPEYFNIQIPEMGIDCDGRRWILNEAMEDSSMNDLPAIPVDNLPEVPTEDRLAVPGEDIPASHEDQLEIPEQGLQVLPEDNLQNALGEEVLERFEEPQDSPEEELQDSPEEELQNSPEEELQNSPEDELQDSLEEELQDSPEEGLLGSPEGELQHSREEELQDSPEEELQDSPEDELQDSLEEELQDSPEEGLLGSPEGEIQHSREEELQDSPEEELQDSPEDELQDSLEEELQDSPEGELQHCREEELQDSPEEELQVGPEEELLNIHEELLNVNGVLESSEEDQLDIPGQTISVLSEENLLYIAEEELLENPEELLECHEEELLGINEDVLGSEGEDLLESQEEDLLGSPVVDQLESQGEDLQERSVEELVETLEENPAAISEEVALSEAAEYQSEDEQSSMRSVLPRGRQYQEFYPLPESYGYNQGPQGFYSKYQGWRSPVPLFPAYGFGYMAGSHQESSISVEDEPEEANTQPPLLCDNQNCNNSASSCYCD